MQNYQTKYFNKAEFHGFYEKMSPKILPKLDQFRAALGCPVRLSNIPAGIGRYLGKNNNSQHNFDKWGEIRAVDGYIPPGISYLKVYKAAEKAGFMGIGLYSGWSGGPGFHLDVRPMIGQAAQWAGLQDKAGKTKYLAITALLYTKIG